MAYYSLPLWNPVLRKVVLSMPCRHNGGAEVQLHSFLTLATKWRRWLTSCPGHFTPREESPYPLNKSLGGPRARLEISEKRKVSCPYWGPKHISCSL